MNNAPQEQAYEDFNRNYADVYNMIQEEQHQEDHSSSDDEEERKEKPVAQKMKSVKKEATSEKGIFGRLGDKISAGLFKASKMNKNSLQKKM